jgi:hypothetical protein
MPVVGTPVPSAPGLVSEADVAAQLAGLTAAQTAALPAVIVAASRAIETYCRRVFTATDYDERYTSDATGRLFLKNRPVISITSIIVGSKDNPTPTTLAAPDFDYDPLTAEVLTGSGGDGFWPTYGGGWGSGSGGMTWLGAGTGRFRDVRVRYRAGFEDVDIPADVKMATILVVGALLGGVARNPSVSSESQGGRSVSYAAAAQQVLMGGGMVADLLGQWRCYR